MKYSAKQYRNKFVGRLSEEQEQAILCKWLKATYPNVLYTIDLGGIKLNQNQKRIMATRSRRGHPDIILQEWFLDKYCGLAIEFKRTGEKVAKLDGTLRKNEHLQRQLEYLTALKKRYYIAGFVCGVENAKKVISAYLEANSNSLGIINKYLYPKISLK